jgi:O-antigen/teichoic acid export membrane protein
VINLFTAQGLFARAMRGSALTAGSYAVAQALRLVSNLILTRILYPEAFGVMALVSVVIVGLALFSDLGVSPAISANPKGDDPEFLDTAYALNVFRGVMLWLMTLVLAVPAAWFYGVPELRMLLPVAGLSLLIAAFNPTRIDTASRHLLLGRVTGLDLLSQILGMVAMVLLALATGSIWALVLGGVFGAAAKLALMVWLLPGRKSRLGWNPSHRRELIHFGKWIFLSTACAFLMSQGDKAILGRYLSLDALGIYNIGFFLASFPYLLAHAVLGGVMIPLYRDSPPGASPENFRRMRRFRSAYTGGSLLLLFLIGCLAQPLVGILYDARYAEAAAVVAMLTCAQMPAIIGLTYDRAALAAGDSRNFFLLMAARAFGQTLAFVIGLELAGLAGAILGMAIAVTLLHPAIILLARRHRAWDAGHDAAFFALGAAMAAVVLWINADILGL